MAAVQLSPEQTISELRRRGVELEANDQSPTGFALKAGPDGGTIPDWLADNLTDNVASIAMRFRASADSSRQAAPAEDSASA